LRGFSQVLRELNGSPEFARKSGLAELWDRQSPPEGDDLYIVHDHSVATSPDGTDGTPQGPPAAR
jgi:hypothetical protein